MFTIFLTNFNYQ